MNKIFQAHICIYCLKILATMTWLCRESFSNCDSLSFLRYLRMSPERFEHLLELVVPFITKKKCSSRKTISPAERLALTIKYLATGDSQQSQSFNFRYGRTTVCNIVRDTCKGIWLALSGIYLKAPKCRQDWENIANDFFK